MRATAYMPSPVDNHLANLCMSILASAGFKAISIRRHCYFKTYACSVRGVQFDCLLFEIPHLQLLAADSLFLVAAVDTVWPLVLELKDKQRELGRALKAFLRVAFHPLLLHSSDISVIEMLQKVVTTVTS